MKLIVGLGNPDAAHANTRHNIGFRVLDAFIDTHAIPGTWKEDKLAHAKTFACTLNSEEIMLVKPQTYMNNSGLAIASLLGQLKCTPQDIIVIYDDVDVELGHVKVRNTGSAGGHNGIKSVISTLKTEEFIRIRLGIKNTNDTYVTDKKIPLEEYVLLPFLELERIQVQTMINETIEYIKKLVKMEYEEFISKYHK